MGSCGVLVGCIEEQGFKERMEGEGSSKASKASKARAKASKGRMKGI